MKKNQIKNRKKLSIGLTLILILIFSVVMLFFGICIGLLINSLINNTHENILGYVILTLIAGIIHTRLLIILLNNRFSEIEKSNKWYINCILISMVFVFIISAVTIFISGPDNDSTLNYIIGFAFFPLIGIITTPNIVKYVLKDTEKWKHIFYKKGNLHTIKKSKDYYRIFEPVPFEKKIIRAIYKEQFLNLLVVIGFMLLTIVAAIYRILKEHVYTGDVVRDMIELKTYRATGLLFFLMIIFLTFGIPIMSFYITNFIKKVKVVRKHEYIAYHAIVSGVRDSKVTIWDNNKHYSYNYCTCVGIKEKNVHFTKAILIFIPDDVLLFPDTENNKEKNEKSI